MRPQLHCRSTLGALALAVTLLLATPGVELAAADPAPSLTGSDAASCSVEDGHSVMRDQAVASSDAMARIQALMQQEIAQGGEAPVVLNPSGYNYQAGRDSKQEMRVIERELSGR